MAQIIKDPAPIRKALKAAGLSEREAADRAGFSQSSKLNLSLHGKRALDLHELIALAKICGVEWPTLLPAFGIADPTASNVTSQPPVDWRIADLTERLERVEEIVRAFGSTVTNSSLVQARK
jgi:transcriptional regulator with XRE-family HTH domain